MTATPPPADVTPTVFGDALASLRRLDRQGEPWTSDALQLIQKYPGVNSAALARRSGVRPPELNSRLRRLRDIGLIEQGDGLGHRLTPLGHALLGAQGQR